jgi:hypothetical protein
MEDVSRSMIGAINSASAGFAQYSVRPMKNLVLRGFSLPDLA